MQDADTPHSLVAPLKRGRRILLLRASSTAAGPSAEQLTADLQHATLAGLTGPVADDTEGLHN